MPPESPVTQSACARCGAPFHCGRDDALGCWCTRLPPLDRARYAKAAACLCEACLRALVAPPGALSSRSTP